MPQAYDSKPHPNRRYARIVLGTALGLVACSRTHPNQPAPPIAVPPVSQSIAVTTPASGARENALFLDPSRSMEERVNDLVGRMTLDEKMAQMRYEASAIPRLGIPAYNWWSEALHGVARAGVATVFPQAIGLAATWDEALMLQVATVISTEARAKHHEFVRQGSRKIYQGLTFFSPNINLFRDPRWGRGHETFGEDPYLTSRMGVAFVKGMQGDHPTYLKTAATAKHYAVHSGPEKDRHVFNARVSKRDLYDTYLPQFEAVAREAKVESFMCAYNAVDDRPACASEPLLEDILRKQFGFRGYVVTDCGAIRDVWRDHRVAKDSATAGAQSVKAGVDLECGQEFKNLGQAVKAGQLNEAEIDRAVKRLFTTRFRLGMFDPPQRVAYAQIPISVNDSAPHRALALEASRRSLVLLENRGALPLKTVRRLAVIGPTADSQDVLVGNYNGIPSRPVTILAGLRKVADRRGIQLVQAQGSGVLEGSPAQREEAVAAARSADTVVLVVGLTPKQEGEENESVSNPSGDKVDIRLPAVQEQLIESILATQKPVVLVLTGGSNLASRYFRKAAATLMTWYPGGEGGTAVAETLFGDYNPAGRLPLTFYADLKDLPDFNDYRMTNRTYRYFTGTPLWPFGHGKSYTTFVYTSLTSSSSKMTAGQGVDVSVVVQNTGLRDGEEVVQVYITDEKASVPVPLRSLIAFRRVALKAGEKKTVSFALPGRAFSVVNEAGQRIVEPGRFTLALGGGQPGKEGRYATGTGATLRLEATGNVFQLPGGPGELLLRGSH